IVSPPKAGKTTVLKQIAKSIESNNPEVHLMVLLVDERPEEVTDMRRSVQGEVVASTFDRPSDEHTALAELAIERARRLVEMGRGMDEVIFEEFKGTVNMELRLDRKLAERRIYPALDVNASSTRHEELLFDRKQLELVWRLRRVLNGLSEGGSAAAGLELLVDKIKSTKSNDEFLAEIAKAPTPAV